MAHCKRVRERIWFVILTPFFSSSYQFVLHLSVLFYFVFAKVPPIRRNFIIEVGAPLSCLSLSFVLLAYVTLNYPIVTSTRLTYQLNVWTWWFLNHINIIIVRRTLGAACAYPTKEYIRYRFVDLVLCLSQIISARWLIWDIIFSSEWGVFGWGYYL